MAFHLGQRDWQLPRLGRVNWSKMLKVISLADDIAKFCPFQIKYDLIFKPWHEIFNNVVCVTNKASDQSVHMHSLIRAFASHFNILWLLSYWLNIIWSF